MLIYKLPIVGFMIHVGRYKSVVFIITSLIIHLMSSLSFLVVFQFHIFIPLPKFMGTRVVSKFRVTFRDHEDVKITIVRRSPNRKQGIQTMYTINK